MTWDELDWTILDRLRAGFLSGSAADGPYWRSHDDLAHYDFTYAERIGWKWDHVLRELSLRNWQPVAGPLLDWGCGSGIASRRVLALWPTTIPPSESLHVFDHSTLAESYVVQRHQANPEAAFSARSWDRTIAPATVVISHVLNELDADSTADLRDTIDRAQCVIWLEPGTSAVARQLVDWREQLRDRFRVVYPCPHQGACGLVTAANTRDWCHHFAPPPSGIFADSHWVRFGQRAGIDLRSLPYSALVLERHERTATIPALPAMAGRIIGRPEVFKPYARLLGCDATGVNLLTLPKRVDPRLWKRLDRADAPRLFCWTLQKATIDTLAPVIPPQTEAADEEP